MAGKITVKLPFPEGVAAGATATFRVPVGRRIHALYLTMAGALTVSDLSEIRIYANSQLIQKFSGVQRDKLNQFDGLPAATNTLVMPFDRVGLITLAGRELTALNTGVPDKAGVSIKSLYVEVDIASGATVTPTDLRMYSKESDAIRFDTKGEPYGPGVIPFIRTEQRDPSGADTDYQISDLVNPGVNAPDKMALVRATFIPSTGTIKNLRVDRNQNNIFDRTDGLNRVIQQAGERVPVSGYYMIDTGENGQGGEVIDLYGMTDFRYRLDVSAGMSIKVISEYFGKLTA